MTTIGGWLERWATADESADRTFLLDAGGRWSWRETWEQAVLYGNLFRALRARDDLPLHVGVLSENRPEFVFALFGCALAGGVVVGLNPTRRGDAMVRDIEHADCQILVVDESLLDGLTAIKPRLAIADERILICRGQEPRQSLPGAMTDIDERLAALRDELGPAASRPPAVTVVPEDWLAIIFTSGSSGAPKAILNSHGKVVGAGAASSGSLAFSRDDVFYAAMPLFHSNSLGLALVPALVHGGTLALARRFTASGFLDDVRRFGATVFNYVGKPFAYILATPERPDDASNPLRVAVGAGATARQQEEFARRFGLEEIVEMFGSTESGATTVRAPGDPRGSCGRLPPSLEIWSQRDQPCPPAEVDGDGNVLNYEDAVGEIVNVTGPGRFEGYYKNPEATAAKMRGGIFRSGDLGYYRIFERSGEPARFLFFAGRNDDWIRKDGENFLADAVEEILLRHPDLVLCSVYGVPCSDADELVMATVVPHADTPFDPDGLFGFLERQGDLSPKWMPDYVRVASSLPLTQTLKVLRRELKREGFDRRRVVDPIWWRERGERTWKPFTAADLEATRARFERSGRLAELDRS